MPAQPVLTPNGTKRAMPKLWTPLSPTVPAAVENASSVASGERAGLDAPSFKPRKPKRPGLPAVARAALVPAKKTGVRSEAVTRYSPTIKELPLADRPRERLAHHGSEALTTAELVAILIRVGNAERSAVSLGEHLLAHFGSIGELAAASVEQLASVKGIGGAKAAQIKAAIEFGKRVSLFGGEARPFIGSPQDLANLVMSDLRYLKKETLKSVLLDTKSRVIAVRTVSIGDLSSSIVHPREVFKDAIVASAATIIVAHNHPSGDPTPSKDDINITKRLIAAGEIIGIELLDHIIVGDGIFVSLKEKGLI